jgi:hypothetical protein
MRAGPLSSPRVVELLNSRYVPVYTSNEDYTKRGALPEDEVAEWSRIYRASLDGGLSAGTVHVYIVAPDGKPLGSLHVAEAAQTEKLIALLESVASGSGAAPGKPLVPPRPQSRPSATPEGSLVLHLIARGKKGASWDGIPSEDWIVLDGRQRSTLIAGELQPGASWDIPRETAALIFSRFYPQTENNNASPDRITEQSLRATVLSAEGGRVRIRLDGAVRLRHDFYPGRKDGREVSATVIGYMDAEPRERRVLGFRLVTEKATYGPGELEVAVSSPDPAKRSRL